MTRRPRRNHSPAFKAKEALAAIRGKQTLVELSQFDVHANQIKQWKDQLLEGATGVFGDETKTEPTGSTIDVKTLHAKIGELTLMRRIDELHLDYPFAGSRMLQRLLRVEGFGGRAAIRRHADEEDEHRGDLPSPEHLQTSARSQNLSLPPAQAGGHPTQPGLPWTSATFHGARICQSLRRRGLVQPEGPVVAAVDHDGSSLLHRSGRGGAGSYGKPEIFNTDQGSRFTSIDFTAVLKKAEIAILLDGRGAWRDNMFIERLWRSIKYEEVYLHAYKTASGARVGIGRYPTFCNTRRPHSSFDRQTPDHTYFNALAPMMVAA